MKTSRLFPIVAALVLAGLCPLKAGVNFHDHVGLQLWSLREQTKADLPAALDLVKSYGISEVETAGTGNVSAEEFNKLLQARGLKAISAHMGYDALVKDLPGALRTAKILGVQYVMTAWVPHQGAFTARNARDAAANFNKWGEAFRAEGITYGYHPHGYEFVPLEGEGGKTAFDIILAETSPNLVSFEMDVFWVFHAGVDPVKMLKQHAGRWSLLHVKDIRKGAVTGLSSGHAAPIDNVAVGTGQIDWPSVLKTAQETGVKHFFIEDETPTPTVCIPDSVKYLNALKL
jgi:sugar phosphate isomerase/epimerase